MSGKVLACSWLSFVSITAAQFLITHAVGVVFSRYTPKTIEIEHKLQPFIPDFIPAVGDIDAFLKVQFPSGSSLCPAPQTEIECRVRARRQPGHAAWSLVNPCSVRRDGWRPGKLFWWFGHFSNSTWVT